MDYKNKTLLEQKYDELGSTRRVGKFFGVSNGTIINWMRKFTIPRIPKLYLYDNNSGWGRLSELYIIGHPFFKKDTRDLGEDDKSKGDVIWRTSKVNIKCSHYSRPMFRVKKKRHDVGIYICSYFNDKISQLIPVETWIIPANVTPHSGIAPSLMRTTSKYHKYRLSLKRGKEFSVAAEKRYNKQFVGKYLKIINQRKRGEKK